MDISTYPDRFIDKTPMNCLQAKNKQYSIGCKQIPMTSPILFSHSTPIWCFWTLHFPSVFRLVPPGARWSPTTSRRNASTAWRSWLSSPWRCPAAEMGSWGRVFYGRCEQQKKKGAVESSSIYLGIWFMDYMGYMGVSLNGGTPSHHPFRTMGFSTNYTIQRAGGTLILGNHHMGVPQASNGWFTSMENPCCKWMRPRDRPIFFRKSPNREYWKDFFGISNSSWDWLIWWSFRGWNDHSWCRWFHLINSWKKTSVWTVKSQSLWHGLSCKSLTKSCQLAHNLP